VAQLNCVNNFLWLLSVILELHIKCLANVLYQIEKHDWLDAVIVNARSQSLGDQTGAFLLDQLFQFDFGICLLNNGNTLKRISYRGSSSSCQPSSNTIDSKLSSFIIFLRHRHFARRNNRFVNLELNRHEWRVGQQVGAHARVETPHSVFGVFFAESVLPVWVLENIVHWLHPTLDQVKRKFVDDC